MNTFTASPILLEENLPQVDLDLIHNPDELPARMARAADLPDPTAICCAVAHAAVDAFHGSRPVHQLAKAVSPIVFEQLAARSRAQQAINRANGNSRTPNRTYGGAGASNNAQKTVESRRPTTRILRARVLRVSPIAAEATVIIQDGARVRAAALRVEEFRGRWRVNVLQIG